VISNQTRAACSFDFEITRMISDQNCTTRSSIATNYIHFEIAQLIADTLLVSTILNQLPVCQKAKPEMPLH